MNYACGGSLMDGLHLQTGGNPGMGPARHGEGWSAMSADRKTMINHSDSTRGFADDPVFSPELLVERCLGKIDFAKRVLDVFLNNVQHDMDELLDAVRAKDHMQLVQTAHRMKGSAASISAQRMQRLMAEIEEAGRQDAIPELETIQPRIHFESESLERVLVRWRSEERTAVTTTSESVRRIPLWRSAF
jgi:HPt (histidine-containing phosphotransfer) domain-containing protein